MMARKISTSRQIEFIRLFRVPQSKRDINIDVVKRTLDEGGDVNGLIRGCCTPLYLASLAGDLSLVRLLLDKGAEVNLPNKGGETPMHIACMTGQVEIVQLLLGRSANIRESAFVMNSDSPVFFHPNRDYEESLGHLRDFKWGEVNWKANFPNYSKCIEYYKVWEGCDASEYKPIFDISHPTMRDLLFNPLVLAVRCGHSEIVSLLLDKGAGIDVSYNGINLLMLACSYGYYEVFRILFQKYMDTNQIIDGLLVKDMYKAFNERLYDSVDVTFERCVKRPIFIRFNSIYYFTHLPKHMKALKVVGLCNLSDDILSVDPETLEKCKTEIKNIKNQKFVNGVSLYVVFERYRDPYYLRNQDLLDSLEKYLNSVVALEQFPLYCTTLRNRLLSSKYRLSLLTLVSQALEGQDWWDKLPLPIQENILRHLDNIDLEKMCRN